MPNDPQISNRFTEIETFISDAQTWSEIEPRLEAHFASYACVLLSGAIEAAVERIVALKMKAVGDIAAETYVVKAVAQRFRNPDWGTINGLLGDFGDVYKASWVIQFPSGGITDDSLQSINTIKNDLAHTGATSLHVTLRDVQSYLESVIPAINYLEDLLVPVVI